MKKCELCNSTARMYCESDKASLCWDCDSRVHSANFLVTKHSRILLCHACQSPTPWTASGPKLAPTVSVCQACVNRRPSITNGEHDLRNNAENNNSNSNIGDDEDDDGDNQIVPMSPASFQPPMVSSSSSSEESSSRNLRGRDRASSSSSGRFSYDWKKSGDEVLDMEVMQAES